MRKSLDSCLKRACCWSACARCSSGRSRGSWMDRRGGDDEHLAQAAEALGLEDHPAQPRVDREPGEPLADGGEPDALSSLVEEGALAPVTRPGSRDRASPVLDQRGGGDGAQLLEQVGAGLDVAAVGRLDEGEAGDVAEPERGHLEDDAGEVGAQDLGVGELRPGLEVLLRVEPDRDALGDAAAAAGALVGRGLADRLDRQPLHLGAHGVAADPRDAGVDDVPDAGDGQRRLGDVGGEHDAAHDRGVAGEDLVLVGRAEAGVERDDLEPLCPTGLAPESVEGVGGVADLALAGQEHQHVARPLGRQLAHRVDDRLGLVALDRLALLVVLRQLEERAVADLDGVRTTRHLDHRGASARQKCAAKRSTSIVALVMITLRSGRRGSSRLR